MGNKKITNLATPSASTDAVNKGYIDARNPFGTVVSITNDGVVGTWQDISALTYKTCLIQSGPGSADSPGIWKISSGNRIDGPDSAWIKWNEGTPTTHQIFLKDGGSNVQVDFGPNYTSSSVMKFYCF